jgi:hypothetical protein
MKIEQFFYAKDKATGAITRICFQHCAGPKGERLSGVLTVQEVQECLDWWNRSETFCYSLEKP